ncbi:hypothetical protein [Heyndrickxia ginsengihumi]|uniref:hypothetical protein n=1 Tax=Heyndrickxia ginsengihumi TaxID=363870 RepID=UPI0004728D6C|nr:hypothetical protein [Heyndrickxia ginsengihumi]
MVKSKVDITKGVYIPSIEACDIWEHMNRGKVIFSKYIGFLPYSLELRRLNNHDKFSTFTSNRNPNKLLSRDVINVKFDNIVKGSEQYSNLYNKQLEDVNEKISKLTQEYWTNRNNWSSKEKLNQIEKIKQEYIYKHNRKQLLENLPDDWGSVSKEKLRHELYENGFTIKRVDKKTGEITEDVYKMYKRSSSKSRKGQCLMIKESLYDDMIKWSRMFLPFQEDVPVDLASLSAYSSLVTSSIEAVKEIDVNSILVVDEVISRWNESEMVNVIQVVEQTVNNKKIKKVDSVPTPNYEIENSIFDGEGLLSSEFYDEGQSMLLLRNHFTKVACFSTNLELFFKEYAKKNNIDYDTWTVKDIFGNEVFLKNVKMILNQSCIKFLKFSYLFKQEGENEEEHEQLWQSRMWEHFKQVVANEGNIWGVCKHDKTNRKGEMNNLPLQRLSYQMVNSFEASPEEIKNLAQFEIDYIMDLKNDPDKFIEHVKLKLNDKDEFEEDGEEAEDNRIDYFSSDKMFIKLYETNKEIIHSNIFKKFRTNTISNYVKDIKRGHVRTFGDYATLFSCPVQYLYHAIGKLNDDLTIDGVEVLKRNEVYTTLFGEEGFGEEFTICRNPHTSASNIWIGKCTYNEEIEKYFKLSPNVIVINTIKENVMNRLSGCDMDSDAVAVFLNENLLKLAQKCYGKYNVCVNGLEADKTPYILSNNGAAKLDHTLGRSTTEIGSIVNQGQLCNSLYWNYFNNGKVREDIYKQTDILTILSMCSIDNAKRKYKIKISSELRKIQKYIGEIIEEEFDGKKPNFFQYIDKKENVEFTHYNTPMDFMYDILSNLEDADEVKTWNFGKFLNKVDINKANRKQREKVKKLVTELTKALESIHSKGYAKKEKNMILSDTMRYYLNKIGKLKIKPDTMSSILKDIDDKKYAPIRTNLLNCLYQAHEETFLNCFKKSHG